MINSTFEIEEKLRDQGYTVIIGIDEAGRGPLAGPVVAGAAVLKIGKNSHPLTPSPLGRGWTEGPGEGLGVSLGHPMSKDKIWNLVRDSKTLSEKQRDEAFDFVKENFHIGIGICDHHTIDRINILEASFLAMKKAVADLSRKMKLGSGWNNMQTIIILDGNKEIPNLSMKQQAVVSGDKLVKSISAASIVAKVTRDRMMLAFHKKYPIYGFDKHKGYGTKLHMEMLITHGPSEIHRQSFAPVRNCIRQK